MGKLIPKVNAEIRKLNIDVRMFDPVLDSARAIRHELDALLTTSRPEEVHFDMTPQAYERYGVVFGEVILPYIILRSRDLGYKIFTDQKAYELAMIQFGRRLVGNPREGYYHPRA